MRLRPSLALSGRPLQSGFTAHSRRRRAARGSQTVVAVLEITADNFEAEVAQVWLQGCCLTSAAMPFC